MFYILLHLQRFLPEFLLGCLQVFLGLLQRFLLKILQEFLLRLVKGWEESLLEGFLLGFFFYLGIPVAIPLEISSVTSPEIPPWISTANSPGFLPSISTGILSSISLKFDNIFMSQFFHAKFPKIAPDQRLSRNFPINSSLDSPWITLRTLTPDIFFGKTSRDFYRKFFRIPSGIHTGIPHEIPPHILPGIPLFIKNFSWISSHNSCKVCYRVFQDCCKDYSYDSSTDSAHYSSRNSSRILLELFQTFSLWPGIIQQISLIYFCKDLSRNYPCNSFRDPTKNSPKEYSWISF